MNFLKNQIESQFIQTKQDIRMQETVHLQHKFKLSKLIQVYIINFSYLHFFYLDYYSTIMGNVISIRKYKEMMNYLVLLNSYTYLYFPNFCFYIYYYINSHKFPKMKSIEFIYFKNNIITNIKNKIILMNNNFYQINSKIKIIGRGWKFVEKWSTILFKIGYAHSFFFNLLPIMKLMLKRKKKKYYKLISSNRQKLISISHKLHLLRMPDRYSYKGVYFFFKNN